MDIGALVIAITKLKWVLEEAITSSSYKGIAHPNGNAAKNAAIRSQSPILHLHEVAKEDLAAALSNADIPHTIYPPLGLSSPELKVAGFIKAKNQDVVCLTHGDSPALELINEGALTGETDQIGFNQSEKSIVVGVRSQLSSVNKNFDTLMERAFAETLNLRLRLPLLTMGEVYLIPTHEYDDQAMKLNEVRWKNAHTAIGRFIRTFDGISGRSAFAGDSDLYKYERSSLVVADFRENPVHVVTSGEELLHLGLTDDQAAEMYENLRPNGFGADLAHIHQDRFPSSS